MRHKRFLVGLAAATLVLALAGGAVLAAEEGRAERKPTPERAGAAAPEKKPAPRGVEKPFGRAVRGLLIQLPDGFVLVSGRHAYRVVPGRSVDLTPHVLKFVVARVEAQDGKWAVTAIKAVSDLRFVQPPAPKSEAEEPQPAQPAPPQPPQESGK